MELDLLEIAFRQLWQVTLLALMVWGVVRVLAKNRPHLAHALWILVLLKCITPPLLSSQASPFSWLSTAFASVEHHSLNSEPPRNDSPDAKFNQFQVQYRAYADENLDQSVLPLSNSSAKIDPPSWWNTLCKATGWIWIAGSGIGVIVATIRHRRFFQWIRRARKVDYPELNLLLSTLATQLGVRRTVTLQILDAPVGPAVVGVVRPTILLPDSLVAGRDLEDLAPLIAHELVHVRRGDLWWALLQTTARCLFWFHPLVLVASAMVTRESERSCDEETVMGLGCSPSKYARGLLEVLEHKHRLWAAPAMPGVRPIDITSARLERIMKLGHGSHLRTPGWVWLVLVVCAATSLPGAALLWAQEPSAQTISTGQQLPSYRLEPAAQDDQPASQQQRAPRQVRYSFRTFDVGNLLTKMKSSLAPGSNRDPAQELLGIFYLPAIPGESSTIDDSFVEFPVVDSDGRTQCVTLGRHEPRCKIIGQTLYVYETDNNLRDIESGLKRWEEFGFGMLTVKMKIVENASAALDSLDLNWKEFLPTENTAETRAVMMKDSDEVTRRGTPRPEGVQLAGHTSPIGEQGGEAMTTVAAGSSRTLPAKITDGSRDKISFATVDPKRINKEFLQSVKQLSAPKIVCIPGTQSKIRTGAERPFITGYTPVKDQNGRVVSQPKLSLIPVGFEMAMTATHDDGTIQLDCDIQRIKIQSVSKFTFDDQHTVQLPVLSVLKIAGKFDVADGSAIVLRHPGTDNHPGNDLAVILTCKMIPPGGN